MLIFYLNCFDAIKYYLKLPVCRLLLLFFFGFVVSACQPTYFANIPKPEPVEVLHSEPTDDYSLFKEIVSVSAAVTPYSISPVTPKVISQALVVPDLTKTRRYLSYPDVFNKYEYPLSIETADRLTSQRSLAIKKANLYPLEAFTPVAVSPPLTAPERLAAIDHLSYPDISNKSQYPYFTVIAANLAYKGQSEIQALSPPFRPKPLPSPLPFPETLVATKTDHLNNFNNSLTETTPPPEASEIAVAKVKSVSYPSQPKSTSEPLFVPPSALAGVYSNGDEDMTTSFVMVKVTELGRSTLASFDFKSTTAFSITKPKSVIEPTPANTYHAFVPNSVATVPSVLVSTSSSSKNVSAARTVFNGPAVVPKHQEVARNITAVSPVLGSTASLPRDTPEATLVFNQPQDPPVHPKIADNVVKVTAPAFVVKASLPNEPLSGLPKVRRAPNPTKMVYQDVETEHVEAVDALDESRSRFAYAHGRDRRMRRTVAPISWDGVIIVDNSGSNPRDRMNEIAAGLRDHLFFGDQVFVPPDDSWQLAAIAPYHGTVRQRSWQKHRDAPYGEYGNLMYLENAEGEILDIQVLNAQVPDYADVFYSTLSYDPSHGSFHPPYRRNRMEQPLRSLKSLLERAIEMMEYDLPTARVEYQEPLIRPESEVFFSFLIANEKEAHGRSNATTPEEVVAVFSELAEGLNKAFVAFNLVVDGEDCLAEEQDRGIRVAQIATSIARLPSLVEGKTFSICDTDYEQIVKDMFDIIYNVTD